MKSIFGFARFEIVCDFRLPLFMLLFFLFYFHVKCFFVHGKSGIFGCFDLFDRIVLECVVCVPVFEIGNNNDDNS